MAVEADAAAACFLLFLAAAPAAVPSSFFLLGAMEDVVALKVEMSLAREGNGRESEEEEDGVSRGEWVKVKPQPSALFIVPAKQSQPLKV